MSNSTGPPLVSIIIPCFNRAALSERAILSALGEGTECEIIAIDDGSTDDTWQRISSFDRVKAFRTENRGPGASRNLGLEKARGRYVRFLDSDDRLLPGSTARLLESAGGLSQSQIVFGDAAVVDEAGRKTKRVDYGYANNGAAGPVAREIILAGPMPCWLPLFAGTVLVEIGGFNENIRLGEDYELTARLLSKGYEFVRIPVPVYELHDHLDDRLSRRRGPGKYERLLHMFETSAAVLINEASPSLNEHERSAIAGFIWVQARDASREGEIEQAARLFNLARKIAGKDAYAAFSPMHRALYRLCDPNLVESALGGFKALLPKRWNP